MDGKSVSRRAVEPSTLKLVLLMVDKPDHVARLSEMLAQQADTQIIVASDCLTSLTFRRLLAPGLMLVEERLLGYCVVDLTLRLFAI